MPLDGNGMTPSLQNPYMMAHPPLLYLGYVGFGIPYAFAMAALLSGQADARWIATTRRWTLAAWTFLGVGILLGAHWAYEEIGWGGFWAWDPVENAALIPWLVGTAFLHSVIVQEKKGMLKVWNVSLIALTFGLSLFGTFLTRSGFLSSVHAFVESGVGPWFLAAIAVIAAFSRLRDRAQPAAAALRSTRWSRSSRARPASSSTTCSSWRSRSPCSGACSSRSISETLRGETIAVSTPYYDFFAVAFGLPLLLLAGIGPVDRLAARLAAGRRARLPLVVHHGRLRRARPGRCSATARRVPGVVALSLCLFVATIRRARAGPRHDRAARARARHLVAASRSPRLIGRNRRRYGGYIVHLAVVVGVIGIVGTSAYATTAEATLQRGQTMRAGDYELTLQRRRARAHGERPRHARRALGHARRQADRHALARQAPLPARGRDDQRGRDPLLAGDRRGPVHDPRRRRCRGGGTRIKALVNPLVNLIWLAGVLLVVGAVIAAWPDRRSARRLVRVPVARPRSDLAEVPHDAPEPLQEAPLR